ncbi:unnamed protein product [Darwinula stevensoni]|uniref:Methionine synthase reductase n=1 Tax=Darwinula stevensoni TaxID=69355 RepID=A0A7R8X393_9CRUS|nr:unnamed protein product [Darwinula stevensoni]CAG0884753.1 unnamed protein product [Darwinula stevensoni]
MQEKMPGLLSGGKRFLLIYASQTGQAKAIAEEIASLAPEHGLLPDLHCISLTEKKFDITQERCVVIVTSTTGEGEPPDTAQKFWRRLKKTTHPDGYLRHLRYALLALGDSNYTSFCNCGKMIEKQLRVLGAEPLCPPGWADDAVGLEIAVEPWIENLWPALQSFLGIEGRQEKEEPERKQKKDEPEGKQEKDNEENQKGEPDPEVQTLLSSSEEPLSGTLVASLGIPEDAKMSLPPLPAPYLDVVMHDVQPGEAVEDFHLKNLPLQEGDVLEGDIEKVEVLTSPDAVKKTLHVVLRFKEAPWAWGPGDSLGLVCPNMHSEVEVVMRRLGLKLQDGEAFYSVESLDESGKKKVPPHIPPLGSWFYLFTWCLNIRAILKKVNSLTDMFENAHFRILSEYSSDERERRCLQWLSSREGGQDYSRRIVEPHCGFIDILESFPSCHPPPSRILEMLPRITPRPYSVACSPCRHGPRCLEFVLSVVEFPAGEGRLVPRKGLCSGWLENVSNSMDSLVDCLEDLHIPASSTPLISQSRVPVWVYKRKSSGFKLPENLDSPIVMIGPGTGLAPFIGFLQHRDHETVKKEPWWLFYGCRHPDKDFLFKEELDHFLASGSLGRLLVSFSRVSSPDSPNYVQDNMRLHSKELVDLITEQGATVYICGDAHNMAKDVQSCFLDIIAQEKGVSHAEALKILENMRSQKKYLQDIWS